MIDFDALASGRIFGGTGCPDHRIGQLQLVVINNIKGVSIEDGNLGLQTIRPAVDVCRSSLISLGIAFDNLVYGEVVGRWGNLTHQQLYKGK